MQPENKPSAAAQACLDEALISANPWSKMVLQRGRQARLLLTEVPTVTVQTASEDALKILLANPELNVLPVLDGKVPVGLLNRTMVDKFSHGYVRDLYSRKSCTVFMEKTPLIVDVEMPVVALSQLVLMQGPEALRRRLYPGARRRLRRRRLEFCVDAGNDQIADSGGALCQSVNDAAGECAGQ
jgi:hypothetical protein